MKYNFDPKTTLTELEAWTKTKMHAIGGTKAVLGISGGKDSSVTAALMTRVLGADNVYGILMPNAHQDDIEYARELVKLLGIHSAEISIGPMTSAFYTAIEGSGLFDEISRQTTLNLPPRVRMTTLYAISQSIDGSRVINTSNLSEDWVGYATIYGDTAGAFAPLGMLTTDEVIAIGQELDLPEKFTAKPPADGLTGKTDEQVLGYTYDTLNDYIRHGLEPNDAIKQKIDEAHRLSRFKFEPIPMFDPKLPIKAKQVGTIYPTL